LILSSLLGSILGVQLLFWLNEGILKLLIGLMMVFYALDQFRAKPLQVSPHIFSMLCFGLLAGIIGGATNAMAPFLMMYLMSCQLSKTDIVIISNLNFIASKLIQLILLFPILIAFETPQQHILIGICLFALAGVRVGAKIRHRLSQQHFKAMVLSLLFVLGIYALWQSAALLQQSHYSIFK
jgi:uncharacterized membrane protein YfcA